MKTKGGREVKIWDRAKFYKNKDNDVHKNYNNTNTIYLDF